MPILDVYAAVQLVFALLGLLAVWGRDAAHRAAMLALLAWFFMAMLSQSITGLYSPAGLSFVIASVVLHFFIKVGQCVNSRWPYDIISLILTAMAFDVVFWATKRAVGHTVFQAQYQDLGVLIFYLCVIWVVFHDRKLPDVPKFI